MAIANKNLGAAKKAKNDEFYTQFSDIQKEIEAYLEYDGDTFRGKVVYCNCDDPFESNFFRYFVLNFERLGLKRLVTTSYKPSPVANTQLGLFGDDKTLQPEKGRPKVTANKLVINEVHDMDGDGGFNLSDVAEQLRQNKNNEWTPLEGDGDFRSPECVELLKQADIVVTNPPFSLFREYLAQLVEHGKKFSIIGNVNAITYKETFPLIKANKLWFGPSITSGDREFQVPESYPLQSAGWRVDEDGKKYIRVKGVRWFTNLEHGRRHQPLGLMSMADNLKFNKKLKGVAEYTRYDNYDAIEVPFTDAIPSDYSGVMGVPITFLDKYSPEQFEILGISKTWYNFANKKYGKQTQVSKDGRTSTVTKLNDGVTIEHEEPPIGKTYYVVDGKNFEQLYARIFIKHRKATS